MQHIWNTEASCCFVVDVGRATLIVTCLTLPVRPRATCSVNVGSIFCKNLRSSWPQCRVFQCSKRSMLDFHECCCWTGTVYLAHPCTSLQSQIGSNFFFRKTAAFHASIGSSSDFRLPLRPKLSIVLPHQRLGRIPCFDPNLGVHNLQGRPNWSIFKLTKYTRESKMFRLTSKGFQGLKKHQKHQTKNTSYQFLSPPKRPWPSQKNFWATHTASHSDGSLPRKWLM